MMANSVQASSLYQKLKPYLAIAEHSEPSRPATKWIYTHYLAGSGFVPVYWASQLRPGWRRLSFEEFCRVYEIPVVARKAA
ncbi:hypothetical protein LLG95_05530 [bacterium]|nr:hypothetical protein [bacterium]